MHQMSSDEQIVLKLYRGADDIHNCLSLSLIDRLGISKSNLKVEFKNSTQGVSKSNYKGNLSVSQKF